MMIMISEPSKRKLSMSIETNKSKKNCTSKMTLQCNDAGILYVYLDIPAMKKVSQF